MYDEIYQVMAYSVEAEAELRFLQEFLRESQKQGALNYELTMRAAILNFYFNHKRTEEFMKAFPDHARFLDQNGQSELMLDMWAAKMRLYHYASRYDEAMEEAEAMRKQMAKRNDPYLSGFVTAVLGTLYYYQDYDEEAIPLMIEGLEQMEQKLPYDLITLFDTYRCLLEALEHRDRYDESLIYNARYERLIAKEEKEMEEDYGDGANNIRVILNQFYCYVHYANAYLSKDELDKAETYIAWCEPHLPRLPWQMTMVLYESQCILYDKRGEYDRALALHTHIMELIEEHEMGTAAIRPAWYRKQGMYLAKARRYDEAIRYYDTAYVQVEALRQETFEKRLAATHAHYKVDRLEIEKQRNRHYFLFALGGCVLLLAILLLIVRYQRRLRAKNRSLVRQIESQDALKKEMRRLQADTAPATSLFAQLEDYLQTTGAFTHPELDRQQLITALGTNQTYLYNAVREATGMSLLEYINSLRLEMAKELFKSNPEATILQIAGRCGFANIRTFRRQFKDFYGMVPSEYRSGLQISKIQPLSP